MRVSVYDKDGRLLESLENVLVPRPTNYTGELFVVYESMGFTVVSKIRREIGERETESVVAVKSGADIYMYDSVPDAILEKLGVSREKDIAKKVTV